MPRHTHAPRARRALGALLLAPTVLACASVEYKQRDWSSYDGPGAVYFHAEEVEFPHFDDPLEPLNRVIAAVNYEILVWVVAPTARVYRTVLPRPVRTHVAKAFENLLFPTRFVNNLLQGNLREGGVELSRFVINTTVGLFGLFDPAQDWGLHPYPEDFGQTFASWGWKPSVYLFLPFLGPSTIRDGLGKIPDTLSDPAYYHFPAAPARGYNKLSNSVESDLRTVEASYDAYQAGRTLYMLQREVELTNFEWSAEDGGPTQTLRAIFLAPRDPKFAERAETERVFVDSDRPALPYSLWLQPEPAPLLFIVPGFGGNRHSDSAVAIAEIAYERGHSVVVISSPTNWEFMRHGASVTMPGFGPVDSHDVHVALTAIDAELESRRPGHFQERRLAGISLGAYQALLIAVRGEDRPDRSADLGSDSKPLMEFELFLALNPPVNFEHALLQLDRFYNAPLSFPPEERAARIEQIYAKVLYLSNGDLEPGIELPFTQVEARFLIGLAFRLELQNLILQSQDLFDSGVLLTRRTRLNMAPAFREASQYSFMEFFYAFVLPYFAEREVGVALSEDGARRLFERSDLHAVADALRADERVHVLANENDFLLRPEDVTWLRETLGDRATLFEEGGHLGNLYGEYLQSLIGAKLDQEAEANP